VTARSSRADGEERLFRYYAARIMTKTKKAVGEVVELIELDELDELGRSR
jgi:hypothetical protein